MGKALFIFLLIAIGSGFTFAAKDAVEDGRKACAVVLGGKSITAFTFGKKNEIAKLIVSLRTEHLQTPKEEIVKKILEVGHQIPPHDFEKLLLEYSIYFEWDNYSPVFRWLVLHGGPRLPSQLAALYNAIKKDGDGIHKDLLSNLLFEIYLRQHPDGELPAAFWEFFHSLDIFEKLSMVSPHIPSQDPRINVIRSRMESVVFSEMFGIDPSWNMQQYVTLAAEWLKPVEMLEYIEYGVNQVGKYFETTDPARGMFKTALGQCGVPTWLQDHVTNRLLSKQTTIDSSVFAKQALAMAAGAVTRYRGSPQEIEARLETQLRTILREVLTQPR